MGLRYMQDLRKDSNMDGDVKDLNEYMFIGSECLDDFLRLPRKTQEIFFAATLLTETPPWYKGDMLTVPQPETGLTPIESILEMAFQTYEMKVNKDYYVLKSQQSIYTKGKHYIVDFYVPKANLIVECDGHDFHQKTKQQVANDNEREFDLKMAGYNIIRFSGSQIYNRPFECAKELYDYIEKLRGE